MGLLVFWLMFLGAIAVLNPVPIEREAVQCPDYSTFSTQTHPPFSSGKYGLSYQRPDAQCRTFTLPEIEDTIASMKNVVKDPDLSRLFENCFPNTLDTAIAWKGFTNSTSAAEGDELTFIKTGDINAMWLRDSANQLQSYKSLLRPSSSATSLASLFRGAINLQSRYILASPHCNAFHAPPEAGLPATPGAHDAVSPAPDPDLVFECKYELDSLAAFLQLSADYYAGTNDSAFFSRRGSKWQAAVAAILNATDELTAGTYAADGTASNSPYKFQRETSSATETLMNGGVGSPVKGDTGMVRSAFRPSDDACTYQLFIPANMMFSRYLMECVQIMQTISPDLAGRMADRASMIRTAIDMYGRADHPVFGKIYAYEVDGYGSQNLMDDANIPSLLSAAMFGYIDKSNQVYQNTRKFALSQENPYFMKGSVISSTGGPHVGFGMAWPMSLIVRIMTSDDDAEITDSLKQILSSTDKLGLIHESINSNNARIWTRQWFSWANGLFGQMMLELKDRKPHLLAQSFQ